MIPPYDQILRQVRARTGEATPTNPGPPFQEFAQRSIAAVLLSVVSLIGAIAVFGYLATTYKPSKR